MTRPNVRFKHLVLAACLCFLAGCGISDEAKVPAWGDDVDDAVLARYHAVGPHHVLLVGDSLTAYNPITELCGLPVIKAGYSGGKWEHVSARPIWHLLESDLIIVMLGTNNALKGPAVSHHDMIAFLTRLRGPMLWVELTPTYYNLAYLPVDAVLPGLQATELGLGYPVLDNRDRLNSPILFVDGIHLNEAGYQKQNELLSAACPKL